MVLSKYAQSSYIICTNNIQTDLPATLHKKKSLSSVQHNKCTVLQITQFSKGLIQFLLGFVILILGPFEIGYIGGGREGRRQTPISSALQHYIHEFCTQTSLLCKYAHIKHRCTSRTHNTWHGTHDDVHDILPGTCRGAWTVNGQIKTGNLWVILYMDSRELLIMFLTCLLVAEVT